MKQHVAALLALLLVLTLSAGCAGEQNGNTEDLTSSDVTQNALRDYSGLGSVMPEMTVTTADGEVLALSALLEEKKLVVLNFWFEDCPWCLREFPVMELAYQRYKEDVEIIALNPVDSGEAVSAFQEKSALSFPMAACPRSWAVEMGISGYPTSVFIDRDGVVCLIHAGAITDTETFYTLFETFTAQDYQRRIYNRISELES